MNKIENCGEILKHLQNGKENYAKMVELYNYPTLTSTQEEKEIVDKELDSLRLCLLRYEHELSQLENNIIKGMNQLTSNNFNFDIT